MKRRWNFCKRKRSARNESANLCTRCDQFLAITSLRYSPTKKTHRVQTFRQREEADLEVLGAVQEALHVLVPVFRVRLIERDGVKVKRLTVRQDCAGRKLQAC